MLLWRHHAAAVPAGKSASLFLLRVHHVVSEYWVVCMSLVCGARGCTCCMHCMRRPHVACTLRRCAWRVGSICSGFMSRSAVRLFVLVVCLLLVFLCRFVSPTLSPSSRPLVVHVMCRHVVWPPGFTALKILTRSCD